jgi:hypothetical protein
VTERVLTGRPALVAALPGGTVFARPLAGAGVDLEHAALAVRRGVHRVRGQGLLYEELKADRSRRAVALPAPDGCTG